jgi:cytochrome c oxidase subunit 2
MPGTREGPAKTGPPSVRPRSSGEDYVRRVSGYLACRLPAIAVVDTRHEYSHLFDVFVPIALVVFAVVAGLIVFALIWYRRGRRDRATGRPEAPVAESLYVVVLAGIVAFLVSLTLNTEAKVDRVSSTSALQVEVTAAKWTWRFYYPAYGINIVSADIRPATLVVPANQIVRFRLGSLDVIHSFYIPALRFKRDAFPGKTTTFDLVFDRSRKFMGECAEFCGLHHADMRFSVEAMSTAQFGTWAEGHRQDGGP